MKARNQCMHLGTCCCIPK